MQTSLVKPKNIGVPKTVEEKFNKIRAKNPKGLDLLVETFNLYLEL
jgi:hypothetical protein